MAEKSVVVAQSLRGQVRAMPVEISRTDCCKKLLETHTKLKAAEIDLVMRLVNCGIVYHGESRRDAKKIVKPA